MRGLWQGIVGGTIPLAVYLILSFLVGRLEKRIDKKKEVKFPTVFRPARQLFGDSRERAIDGLTRAIKNLVRELQLLRGYDEFEEVRKRFQEKKKEGTEEGDSNGRQ